MLSACRYLTMLQNFLRIFVRVFCSVVAPRAVDAPVLRWLGVHRPRRFGGALRVGALGRWGVSRARSGRWNVWRLGAAALVLMTTGGAIGAPSAKRFSGRRRRRCLDQDGAGGRRRRCLGAAYSARARRVVVVGSSVRRLIVHQSAQISGQATPQTAHFDASRTQLQ